MLALQRSREKRIRMCRGRQRFIVQAHDPKMVEPQARSLQHSHHLYRRAFIFHLKTSVGRLLMQPVESLRKIGSGRRKIE